MIDFVKIQDASNAMNQFVTQYTNYCNDMIRDLQVLENIVARHNSYLRDEIHQFVVDYSELSKRVNTTSQNVSLSLNQYVADSKQNLLNLTNDLSSIVKEFSMEESSIDML